MGGPFKPSSFPLFAHFYNDFKCPASLVYTYLPMSSQPAARGAIFNYVDQILPINDHLSTFVIRNYFTSTRENLDTNEISSTTYLPHLVNVVKERPPSPSVHQHKSKLSLNKGNLWSVFAHPFGQIDRDSAQGHTFLSFDHSDVQGKILISIYDHEWYMKKFKGPLPNKKRNK